MDIVDLAQEQEIDFLNFIFAQRNQKFQLREFYPIGRCNWCSELFMPEDRRIFCDSNCTEASRIFSRKNVVDYCGL